MAMFDALPVAGLTICLVMALLFLARKGFRLNRLRFVIGCSLGLVVAIRLSIFDDSRGFAYLFFPAIALLGTNAFLGMQAYYSNSRAEQA